MRYLLLFGVLLLFVACNNFMKKDAPSTSEENGTPETERLNGEYTFKYGETQEFAKSKLSIAFMEVLEDSRCPTGVDCMWEGLAKIQLGITQGANESEQTELTLRSGQPDLAKTELADYQIELLEVNPYPKKGSKIAKEDYQIRLRLQ